MPQSLSQNYVHLIFSTKERQPRITAPVQERLYPYLAKALEGQDCPALKIGGVADHIHVLFRLSKNVALSKVIGSIKGESSKWLKEVFPELQSFAWQGGYGAFSVSASHLDRVTNTLMDRPKTFKEEFRAFLIK